MLFSSLEFIFLYLPINVAVYFVLPRKIRNFWLLLGGLVFYAFGEPSFLPLMALTIALDFLFGLWIEKRRERAGVARLILVLAVALNIGALAFFKYFDFFGIGLPIGISFYTFQALSYVIDVYRREVRANKSIIDFGAYVSLFPQLIAGPIVRYSDIESELSERKSRICDVADGFRLFCVGLAKKVILANPAGQMWNELALDKSFLGSYFAIFFFAMQIYFDFSGYSDMALGLGRAFGFHFPRNFNYPYIAKSITDFWRRWHMTLSYWFREYVYIPLGGNRCGNARMYLNLLITWGLTGIWHGASVNFLLWGLYFAIILIIEKSFLQKVLLCIPRAFSHIYALFFILLGWVIFVSDGSIDGFDGFSFALRLVGVGCESFISPNLPYEFLRNAVFATILILGCTPLPCIFYKKLKDKLKKSFALINTVAPIAVFFLSVAYIVSSEYNPFLYFRF